MTDMHIRQNGRPASPAEQNIARFGGRDGKIIVEIPEDVYDEQIKFLEELFSDKKLQKTMLEIDRGGMRNTSKKTAKTQTFSAALKSALDKKPEDFFLKKLLAITNVREGFVSVVVTKVGNVKNQEVLAIIISRAKEISAGRAALTEAGAKVIVKGMHIPSDGPGTDSFFADKSPYCRDVTVQLQKRIARAQGKLAEFRNNLTESPEAEAQLAQALRAEAENARIFKERADAAQAADKIKRLKMDEIDEAELSLRTARSSKNEQETQRLETLLAEKEKEYDVLQEEYRKADYARLCASNDWHNAKRHTQEWVREIATINAAAKTGAELDAECARAKESALKKKELARTQLDAREAALADIYAETLTENRSKLEKWSKKGCAEDLIMWLDDRKKEIIRKIEEAKVNVRRNSLALRHAIETLKEAKDILDQAEFEVQAESRRFDEAKERFDEANANSKSEAIKKRTARALAEASRSHTAAEEEFEKMLLEYERARVKIENIKKGVGDSTVKYIKERTEEIRVYRREIEQIEKDKLIVENYIAGGDAKEAPCEKTPQMKVQDAQAELDEAKQIEAEKTRTAEETARAAVDLELEGRRLNIELKKARAEERDALERKAEAFRKTHTASQEKEIAVGAHEYAKNQRVQIELQIQDISGKWRKAAAQARQAKTEAASARKVTEQKELNLQEVRRALSGETPADIQEAERANPQNETPAKKTQAAGAKKRAGWHSGSRKGGRGTLRCEERPPQHGTITSRIEAQMQETKPSEGKKTARPRRARIRDGSEARKTLNDARKVFSLESKISEPADENVKKSRQSRNKKSAGKGGPKKAKTLKGTEHFFPPAEAVPAAEKTMPRAKTGKGVAPKKLKTLKGVKWFLP